MAGNMLEMGIKLDSQGLTRGLSDAQNKISGFAKSLESLNGGKLAGNMKIASGVVTGLSKAFGVAGVAAVAATAAVVGLANSISKVADELDESAQKMGVSLEFYQKLQSAALKSGADMSTMKMAMKTVVNTAYDASNGNEKLANTYKSIGVSVTDSSGKLKDQEQLFGDVLLALSEMDAGTRRSAIANDLLGKSAMELAPLINSGSDAVKKYVTENEGAVIVNRRMAKASSDYRDTIQTMKEALLKTTNEALTPFMESISGIAQNMANSEGFKSFLKGVRTVFDALAQLMNAVNDYSRGEALKALEKNQQKYIDNQERLKKLKYEIADAESKYGYNSSLANKIKADNDQKYEILKKQTEELRKQNEAEQERLNKTYEWKDLNGGGGGGGGGGGEKIKSVSDDYANLVAQAKEYAKIAREGILGETAAGQIKLLQEQRDFELETISKVQNKDIDKAKAKHDIEVYYANQIKDVQEKNNKELADAAERRRKEDLEKAKADAVGLYQTFSNFGEIYQNYINSEKALNTKAGTSETTFLGRFKRNKDMSWSEMGGKDPYTVRHDIEYANKATEVSTSMVSAYTELQDVQEQMAIQQERINSGKYAEYDIEEATMKNLEYKAMLLNQIYLNQKEYINSPQFDVDVANKASGKPRPLQLNADGSQVGVKQSIKEWFKSDGGTSLGETLFGKEDMTKITAGVDIAKQSISIISQASQFAFEQEMAREQAKIDLYKKTEYERIDGMVLSNRKRKQLQDQVDKEVEARQKAIQKETLKRQRAQIWANTASGIAGAWMQAFSVPGSPPPVSLIMAGVSTAALLANAVIQSATIEKSMDGLATGGFVNGIVGNSGRGSSMGGDNMFNVNLREGEMVLNARQQKNMLKKLDATPTSGGNITVQIMGNVDSDSRAKEVEDTLTTLFSNGRLSFIGA